MDSTAGRPVYVCQTTTRKMQIMMTITIDDIACVCHEANRAYCLALGDYSQAPWDFAPLWQRKSAINGVQFHVKNPDSKAAHSPECWLA